jgi:hypothetical protein
MLARRREADARPDKCPLGPDTFGRSPTKARDFRLVAAGTELVRAPPRKVGTVKDRIRVSTGFRAKLGVALALAAMSSTAGCYKATFVEDPSAVRQEPTHEEWSNHYVFGLVGDKEYDTREWCPEGVSMARTGGNVGTSALTIVTLGIYAPRKVYVTCAERQVASADRKEGTQ